MLKDLRIAVTALSLTACVLLVALWVRSYRFVDYVSTPLVATQGLGIRSEKGRFCLVIHTAGSNLDWSYFSWKTGTTSPIGPTFMPAGSWAGPGVESRFMWYAAFPHSFAALLVGALSVAPWIKWSRQFRLRTLLIATTLVAVGLGIIAMSS